MKTGLVAQVGRLDEHRRGQIRLMNSRTQSIESVHVHAECFALAHTSPRSEVRQGRLASGYQDDYHGARSALPDRWHAEAGTVPARHGGLAGRRLAPSLAGAVAAGGPRRVDRLRRPLRADHLVIGHSPYWGIPEGESRGTWEAWTIRAALAAETRRAAIGAFVIGAGFRNPALLAKMAATVDEVSGGRLILGLGCGSHPPEYAAFGYPYDHRVNRFEEALQILVPLLRGGRVDFVGRYHAARACELLPRGPRPSGPPIWIAAYQPRMMRLAARWGDAFVTAWHPGVEGLGEPLARLEDACAAVGRDPTTLGRTVGVIVRAGEGPHRSLPMGTLGGTPEEIAAGLLAFRTAGFGHIACMLDPRTEAGIERFAPVIELVRRAER
jgi:alkanesulfonate monooxygenase SsuD/methylene tetrahydromethanopterin reductase-like flavin-dependent oxidoreductase (luciferase family)